jgi:hypothetical protein
MKKITIIACLMLFGFYWTYRIMSNPPIDLGETWDDKTKGFVKFEHNGKRVAYILISELDLNQIGMHSIYGGFLGVRWGELDFKIRNSEYEVEFGRKPKVIFISKEEEFSAREKEINYEQLCELIKKFRADIKDQHKADSVEIAKVFFELDSER